MKKQLCVLLSLIMVFMLSGCSEFKNQIDNARDNDTVRVTVPEGYTIYQIASLLEKNEVCSAEDFLAACNKVPDDFKYASGITDTENRVFALEGYVYPNTYDFYIGEDATHVLNKFLSEFETKMTDDMVARAKELGYTVDEIIILASIIQSEADSYSEMVKVSSVFHNRLSGDETGHLLQSDVTYLYINNRLSSYLGEDKVAVYSDLYNTYKCKGLPAGAICNPGADAIKAALYPEDTDYYYFFVSNGKYYYNKDYESHSKAWASVSESA